MPSLDTLEGFGGSYGGSDSETVSPPPRKPTRIGVATPMALTDVLIRKTKAMDRPIKLFDGSGLFLLVTLKASPGWRFKYRFEGRERGPCTHCLFPAHALVGRTGVL